jgi:hypothetical protein
MADPMVSHIVLFQPRPDLSAADQVDLVEALENALRGIPSVRRVQVGKRIRHGTGYEALMSVDLGYAAVLEFDDLAGLQDYLHHPAHQALGKRFMTSLSASAIYDYEMHDASEVRQLLGE